MLFVCVLVPEEVYLSKVLVYYCFFVFRHIDQYISLDLFYDFLIYFLMSKLDGDEWRVF